MKNALEKAIEGGYGNGREDFILQLPEFALSQVWLDPLFWQALGKAHHWEEKCTACGEYKVPHDYRHAFQGGGDVKWLEVWHNFIDSLAEGKSPDEFFKELLK